MEIKIAICLMPRKFFSKKFKLCLVLESYDEKEESVVGNGGSLNDYCFVWMPGYRGRG